DRTPPSIAVHNVQDGGVYRSAAPEVEASDLRLVRSTVTLDGAPFVNGTAVEIQGGHLLAAEARDCAGNTASRSVAFAIDRIAPQISIQVAACSRTATPVITVIE